MLAVSEARVLVGLQADDTSRDARLKQLIDAAYEQAELYVGPLTQRAVTEHVQARGGRLILSHLPVTAIQTVTGLDTVDSLIIAGRSGLVSGLPNNFGYDGWGWGGWSVGSAAGQVAVTYLYGYETVPASVEEGVRAWVVHRWRQEAFGSDTYGADAVAGAVTDFDGLPNAVRNAWAPFLLEKGWGIA